MIKPNFHTVPPQGPTPPEPASPGQGRDGPGSHKELMTKDRQWLMNVTNVAGSTSRNLGSPVFSSSVCISIQSEVLKSSPPAALNMPRSKRKKWTRPGLLVRQSGVTWAQLRVVMLMQAELRSLSHPFFPRASPFPNHAGLNSPSCLTTSAQTL